MDASGVAHLLDAGEHRALAQSSLLFSWAGLYLGQRLLDDSRYGDEPTNGD